MYDHPAQRAANDALWAAVAHDLHAQGIDAPARLDRDRPVEAIWRDPALLLAQACGFPLVADPDLDLRVIAVPSYAVTDCAPGRHCSRIVVRAEHGAGSLADLRGSVAAINAPLSNTGANLLRASVAPLAKGQAFFDGIIVTGSHRDSVRAVAAGRADVAAIDAVTFAAIERFEPGAVAGLRSIGTTRSTPALPLVTARATPPAVCEALGSALAAALRDPALSAAREALFLADILPGDSDRYHEVRDIRREAATTLWPCA
ncbi:phosphate ABC transporter substrate-binding protein [Sphingomonas sp. Leaf16]|nr:phosphate ABC transporter substrate-binding protein [Sphingomonas sp. Leaf16]KQN11522.1 phosphate ABC transporter substrate-binding protein [Sphingomonas sp. Leaf29]KQN18844.1 phosphate ABC transporter substrate-binding protein [Sphingomonas sp. Leaf32]